MLPCPNCRQLTLPCSDEAGLLTDWCDSCDKSIFDNYVDDNVQLPSDTWDGGQVYEP
jgi:hypothetical protein